ncbi:hypothetical protein [Streptomyces sp. NPDC050504]|uniref:hypothetical protein n=1 Tax=Streptomyces sp. NPDC050504 TaxID=3365618 RepID=UPI00378F3410
MISEPELVGGDGAPPPEPVPPDHDGAARHRPLRERPWAWGLTGALLASALWTVGLYTGDRTPEPDRRGYHLDDDTCERIALAGLTAQLGRRDRPTDTQEVFQDPAYNRVSCNLGIRTTDAPEKATYYTVEFTVEQHLRTDPGPEFEAVLRSGGPSGMEPNEQQPVEGLGDEAYFMTVPDIMNSVKFAVRDGGTVLTLRMNAFRNGPVDVRAEHPGALLKLIEADVRAAMAALKR